MTTREQLLHNICLLLSSRTREIVKAALGFIKVILFIVDPKTLASHVTVMVGIDLINAGDHYKGKVQHELLGVHFADGGRWKHQR